MKPVVVAPAARVEAVEASDYYDQRQPGLGEHFTAAVEACWARLQPVVQWPVVEEWEGREIRRAIVRGPFPYHVIFVELEHEVRVLAVMHTARDPGYWHGRI